ncbi:MAG: 23S rRNA (guanosine(2251)-2'-O)-methyltransferase RlmB [Desulfobacterales bacterium]
MKAEILYGFYPVYEALRAGRRAVHQIYICKHPLNKRIKRIRMAADQNKLPIKVLSPTNLQAITGNASHQGIAAKVSPYPLTDVGDILKTVLSDVRPLFLLILDHIVDPHNLGALIRTALCAGVDGVIIPKDRSAYPSPTVCKVSSGALEHMRVAQVNNIVRCVKSLKERDVWIVGLDPSAPQSIYAAPLKGALGLVVGGEEKGLRPLVRKECDFLMSIPQRAILGSLNASVAGAIAMYETYRQRWVDGNP